MNDLQTSSGTKLATRESEINSADKLPDITKKTVFPTIKIKHKK